MAALAVRFAPDASSPCSTACSCNLGPPADKPSLLHRSTRASGSQARSSSSGLVFALTRPYARTRRLCKQAPKQPRRTCACAQPRAGPLAAPSSSSRSPRPGSSRSSGA
eukprot:15437207-Alexandrium_andersonii.AAC.1